MKQKDLVLIGGIVVVSAIISLFVSKAIFVPPKNRQQEVEVVQPISASFSQPDSKYFNANAFDPTQPITVGQNANNDPFKGTGN